MPNFLFKNNKGSSPIVFVILIGILVLVTVGGGYFYISNSSEKQKTLKQVNEYLGKRKEVVSKLNEIPKFELKVSTLEESVKILDETIEIWDEVEKSPLPSDIKSELKNCHRDFKDELNYSKDFYKLNLMIIKSGKEATTSELDKLNSLSNQQRSQAVTETCKKSQENFEKVLNEKGIKLVKEE